MKKLRLFMLVGVILCCLMALAGCKDATAISTPTGLRIDEATLTLRWNAVSNAKGYQLDIECEDDSKNSKRKDVLKNSDDLTALNPGVYTIRVKAIAKNGYGNSKWSKEVPFEREEESGLVYKLINANTEYKVSSFGEATGDVVIASTYRNKPVTTIGEEAFTRCETITSITIPEGIKTIEKRAFFNCFSLKEISIPETVTSIGERAFMGCKALESVELPDSITALPQRVFSGCSVLKSVTFGENLTTIGDYAFATCQALESVDLPETVTSIGQFSFSECYALTEFWGEGLTSIGDSAFYMCAYLQNVSLGENLKTIGKQAFAYNVLLDTIVIPDSVESISDAAFYYCASLANVKIGEGVKQVGYLAFAETKIWKDAVTAGKLIVVDGWIVGTPTLDLAAAGIIDEKGFLTIPDKDGIVGISDMAFYGCYGITKLELPNTLKYIGSYAVPGVTTLLSITFGSGLEEIGESAFRSSTALGSLVFNETNNLKKISNYAFAGCKDLSEFVNFPTSVESIGTNAFAQTAYVKGVENGFIIVGNWVVGYAGTADKVVIPEGTKGISAYAFSSRNTILELTIPASVEVIDQAAFYNCASLKKVTFNADSNLKELKSYAFTNCQALETIEIPGSVKKIEDYAFYGCAALKNAVLKTGVEELGNYVFYGCAALERVEFSSTLTTMGGRVFSRCAALKTVIFPNSLTTIGEYTFYQCEKLESVRFGNGVKIVGRYTFADCASLVEVTLSDSIEKIDSFAFYKCVALKRVRLGESVEEIANYAFYGCESLQYVNIPDSVTTIGGFVFRGCDSLKSIMLGENVKSVAAYAFYGANSLTIYAESEACPEGWLDRWNMSYRPVVWGCTFSEEEYTISFVMKEGAITNANEMVLLSMPMKEGYTCIGWATTKDATKAEYTIEGVVNAPEGTVLYAVWEEGEPKEFKPVAPETEENK